mmetsp:Transcript_23248/g.56080  ORF Transcript_23248/g.56080 Transcript_23248/m.56080 type:complete len:492 (+) Transcript_23248:128-1603(+)|eukprot:CAMPEP_0181094278 /NCGR_PEP_ID=MMETSP1071-20121207/9908_1 /TAXON_ID=35127 /ORGANISM="Thalassiosira sp., Strain NH16" /LENGTH=491 /DNA_ID=CAMNT_0023176597 /DNA_START=52 /DNA_END=1527 /DNA_ORIENTATION=-
MPSSPQAEQAVKRLSRLEGNLTCPNCGAYSKYGFSNICIKYYTFVCNACKSSHQAVSHRCKSLTMSGWDAGEVLQLKSKGNEYARMVWLGNAPKVGTGGRPKAGDDIGVFKRFVVEAYERKTYYREPQQQQRGGDDGDGAVKSTPRASARAVPSPSAAARAPPPRRAPPPPVAARPAPVAPAAPAVDLLDFGAFDTNATPSPAVVAQQQQPAEAASSTAPTAGGGKDPFFATDPFGADSSSNAASNLASGAVVTNEANSFSNPPFDPFGGSISSSVSAPPNNAVGEKAPIMNNSISGNTTAKMPMNVNNGNRGGMMMNGNVLNNGGMMMNNNFGSNNGGNGMMMMNGNNNAMMMANNAMMNPNNHMMNNSSNNISNGNPMMMMMNGGSNNSSNMMMPSNIMAMGGNPQQQWQQQQMQQMQPQQQRPQMTQQQPAMNMNIMQPMNNSISNSFGGSATMSAATNGNASAHSGNGRVKSKTINQKHDPFAGLGF